MIIVIIIWLNEVITVVNDDLVLYRRTSTGSVRWTRAAMEEGVSPAPG